MNMTAETQSVEIDFKATFTPRNLIGMQKLLVVKLEIQIQRQV
jgi:hypothetical protein